MMYKLIGYFNGVDAVMMSDFSADKVIANMKKGIGNYCNEDDDDDIKEDEEFIIANNRAQYTSDKKYIVVYDVSNRFDNCPIDLLGEEARNEFIDIYMKI